MADLVDDLVPFAEASLGDDGSSVSRRCASTRRTASGKYLDTVLRCHASAAQAGRPVAPDCLDKAGDKLVRAFDKSFDSADGNCDTTAGESETLDAMDAIADAALTALAGGDRKSTRLNSSHT